MQQQSNFTTEGQDKGDAVKSELFKYIRFWPVFLMGLILALLAAYIYLRYTPKVYQTTAKIKILNKTKGLELPSAAFVFNRSNINLENEIEILKSYRIIDSVVRNLDLTMRVFEEGNLLTTELHQLPFKVVKTKPNDAITNFESYRVEVTTKGFGIMKASDENSLITFPKHNTKSKKHNLPFELDATQYRTTDMIGKTYIIKLAPIWAVTRSLKGQLGVATLGKTSDILQLSLTSQSKQRNEQILNELIDVFNRDGISDRQLASLKTMNFIKTRFKLLMEEIDSVEQDIKTFKQDNSLFTLESDAQLGISQRTRSEEELFELENQLLLIALLKDTIENPDEESSLLPANIGIASGPLNGLVDRYNVLILQRDDLARSAASNNPLVQSINKQINDLRRSILNTISQYQIQLETTKAQLAKQNTQFNAQVYSLPAKEKRILDITREQEIKKNLYSFLLQKYEEAQINFAITSESVKRVENALSRGMPVSPVPRSVYTMAVGAGLLIPFGIIYLLMLLDTKLKNRGDLQKVAPNIPVVGELPKVKDRHILFKDPNDHSVHAEAFRILSSNVDYILPVRDDKMGKVIFCTSTIKGEGKTYVSINLSLALSSLNKKVLLIGADLRNPQIHTHIGKDKHSMGLSNYLHEFDCNWKTALINGFDKHPNHDILLSGSMPPNPAHLLTNGRFKALIETAKLEYDYIVVDTAPTILVTDTMLISQLADATIYITRANFTEKKLLNYSKELSDSGKLKNMAYVVNSVGASKSYGYSYNYGYNYGYGSKS